MQNHNFLWENPLLMVMFNSYVKLPEGIFNSYPRILSTHATSPHHDYATSPPPGLGNRLPQLGRAGDTWYPEFGFHRDGDHDEIMAGHGCQS